MEAPGETCDHEKSLRQSAIVIHTSVAYTFLTGRKFIGRAELISSDRTSAGSCIDVLDVVRIHFHRKTLCNFVDTQDNPQTVLDVNQDAFHAQQRSPPDSCVLSHDKIWMRLGVAMIETGTQRFDFEIGKRPRTPF